ncbi:MAG: ABC transporter substrate-binding protein [Spirochaetaceae bacterium]
MDGIGYMRRQDSTLGGTRLRLFALILICALVFPVFVFAGGSKEADAEGEESSEGEITVTDALGREVSLPENPEHIICSGSGALRLVSYLERQDRVVAVDDMETRRPEFDARPYALANPQFRNLPTFGEFRGHDNPERIVSLEPLPQVIFKTYPEMGMSPEELERKTGVPVVALNYGDLFGYRDDFFRSLRTLGKVLEAEERAEELVSFFEESIADLSERTEGVPEEEKRSCYVGGIAFKGPHGLTSTEPAYPPFMFVEARNVAYDPQKSLDELQHAHTSRESIVKWDPEVLFVDVSTLQSDPQSSALYQLKNDPAYDDLTAVEEGEVYGVLPYNWYTRNFGSIIANAYFIGTVLYPDRFDDIEPAEKADEIYEFLVGAPVFEELNSAFDNLSFGRISF